MAKSDYADNTVITEDEQTESSNDPDGTGNRLARLGSANSGPDVATSKVHFTVHAPAVFATLRSALGVTEEDFLMVSQGLFSTEKKFTHCYNWVELYLQSSCM